MHRLALALVLSLVALGCSSGGAGLGSLAPGPQWGRFGRDSSNTRAGASLFQNDGRLQWSLDAGGAISTTPAVGPTGTIYVGTEAGSVVAVDPTGVLKWEFTDGGALAPVLSSLAVDQNDIVYFGTEDGTVFAVDADGSEVWRFDAGSPVRSSPLLEIDFIDDVVSAVFVTTVDGRVIALGGPDGTPRWQVATGSSITGSLAQDFDGRLYVTSDDGVVHALTRTGSIAFDLTLDGVEAVTGSPSAGLTTFFQPTVQSDGTGRVVAFTPAGTRRWSFVAGSAISTSLAQSIASTVIDDALVLVSQLAVVDDLGSIYLVDQSTGRASGSCLGGEAEGRPCWVDGNCPGGTCGGEVFFDIGERVIASPVAGGDGTIVVSTAPVDGGPGRVVGILPKVCIGGLLTGNPCRTSADCDGDTPGECDPDDGNEESFASLRWTFVDGTCAGGDADGGPCSSDADCPGDPAGVCVTGLGPVRSGASIASNGSIYLGSDNHQLYALGTIAP